MSGNQISGTIPPEITFMFTKLSTLDFSNNQVGGNLGLFGSNLRSDMPYLNDVKLENNKLTGQLSGCGLAAGGATDPATKSSVLTTLDVRENSLLLCAEDCWKDFIGNAVSNSEVKLLSDTSLKVCVKHLSILQL